MALGSSVTAAVSVDGFGLVSGVVPVSAEFPQERTVGATVSSASRAPAIRVEGFIIGVPFVCFESIVVFLTERFQYVKNRVHIYLYYIITDFAASFFANLKIIYE